MVRRGGRYRGSRSDQFEVKFEYELFTTDNNGKLRKPEPDQKVPKTFTFSGAIENFRGEFNDESQNYFDFDFDGDNDNDNINVTSPTLDLTARYIRKDSPITLPDGTAAVDVFNGSGLKAEGADRIEYVFTNGLENRGINELTLILQDADKDKKGFQVDENKDEPGFQVRGQTVGIEAATINTKDAIKNIKYIANNGLLGLYEDIRVSGVSSSDVNQNQIVSVEGAFIDDINNPRSIPIVIEAEKLNRTNYLIENFKKEKLISLRGVPRDPLTGQATGQASLSADDFNLNGNYELTISYFDENDGEAKLEVFVNGNPQDQPIFLNESTSSDLPREDIRREKTIPLNDIGTGDTITIQGTSDRNEWARIDYIIFEEIFPSTNADTELV